MEPTEQKRFDALYEQHLRGLKLHGYRATKIALFPCPISPECIRQATTHMSRGGTQKAMKVLLAECGIKKRFPFIHCGTVLQPICWNAD